MARTIDGGGWIVTRSGRRVWPLDPRPEDIDIDDIAYALAGTFRFRGHSRITVAQHSVAVAHAVPRRWRLAALLHDAAEAYLGDLPRPLKEGDYAAQFRDAERKLLAVILRRFDVVVHDPGDVFSGPAGDAIRTADELAARVEMATLPESMRETLASCPYSGGALFASVPMRGTYSPVWEPLQAEERFLAVFHSLTHGF